MLKFDARKERSKIHLQLEIESPLTAFLCDFLPDDLAHPEMPLMSVSSGFLASTTPSGFEPGSSVPAICGMNGLVSFKKVVWGLPRSDGEPGYFESWTGERIGLPALIPLTRASFGWKGSKGLEERVGPGRLYIAAQGALGGPGKDVEYVAPLICEAHPEAGMPAPWQPVFVSISAIPTRANFDYLLSGVLTAPPTPLDVGEAATIPWLDLQRRIYRQPR